MSTLSDSCGFGLSLAGLMVCQMAKCLIVKDCLPFNILNFLFLTGAQQLAVVAIVAVIALVAVIAVAVVAVVADAVAVPPATMLNASQHLLNHQP